jgi:hypothetical protein
MTLSFLLELFILTLLLFKIIKNSNNYKINIINENKEKLLFKDK